MSGHRWRILALTFFIWVVPGLLAYAQLTLIKPWYSELGEEFVYFVRFVRSLFVISITACVPAAAYCLLRSEKHGPGPGTMARVFD